MGVQFMRESQATETTTLLELTADLCDVLQDDAKVSSALEQLLRGGYLRTQSGRRLRLREGTIVVPEELREDLL